MNENEISAEVLDRYLAGDCSLAERVQVEAWLARQPGGAEQIAAIRSALEPASVGQWDAEVGWRRFQKRRSEPLEAIRDSSRPLRSPVPGLLLRAAALAALLVGGVVLWRSLGPGAAGPGQALAVVTTAGQRDTVSLADGSTVILAPASQLAAQTMDGPERVVELSGEAYFRVAEAAGRPFRVRAGESITEVLGTEFNVRARGGAEPVVVAVRSGRVALERVAAGAGRIELEPGQVGRLPPGGTPERVIGRDGGLWMAWLDGILEFDGASLDAVTAEFARWFGVDVRLADPSLGARRVSGRFAATTPADALDALALALDLSWRHDGSVYVIGRPDGENQ